MIIRSHESWIESIIFPPLYVVTDAGPDFVLSASGLIYQPVTNTSKLYKNYKRGVKIRIIKFIVLGSIQQISSEEACKTDYVSLRSLSRIIQLLHLDQAWVEYLIGNVADGHIFTVGDEKRVSCCRGVNETNYFMYRRAAPWVGWAR